MTDIISIVIADDQTLFREGIISLINSVDGVDIIGQAADGHACIKCAHELMPDVILMDVKMPEMNGIEATRQIVQALPHIAILMLTMYEDDDSVFAAMRAGARGYLLKGADQHEMLRAIRAVANGEAIFAPSVATRLMSFFDTPRQVLPQNLLPELTPREIEVLTHIADGKSNKEIAVELIISPKTVRNHISNIYSKLQVTDRVEAILYAQNIGLRET